MEGKIGVSHLIRGKKKRNKKLLLSFKLELGIKIKIVIIGSNFLMSFDLVLFYFLLDRYFLLLVLTLHGD